MKSLRAVTPEGPYILGGWCNGALLAYEMARQLQAEGQVVENLVLLDSVYLRYPWWLRMVLSWAISGLGTSIRLWAKTSNFSPTYGCVTDTGTCGMPLPTCRSPGYRKQGGPAAFARDDYPGVTDWTAMGYAPETLYSGKITFFWSTSRPSLNTWLQGHEVPRCVAQAGSGRGQ